MASKHPEKRSEGGPAGDAALGNSQPEQAPAARERRSRHRVADDQKSGQGSLSALSKMRMMERRREMMKPRQKDPGEDGPG
jgi:hypothetical protein